MSSSTYLNIYYTYTIIFLLILIDSYSLLLVLFCFFLDTCLLLLIFR